MPRRKLARRFEPRYGVSQIMLDTESQYVRRELEDQLIQSTSDLTGRPLKWRENINIAEQELSAKFAVLPDRERLALRSMFARDCWHMAKLYLTFLKSPSAPEQVRPETVKPAPAEVDAEDNPMPMLPFKQTLFD